MICLALNRPSDVFHPDWKWPTCEIIQERQICQNNNHEFTRLSYPVNIETADLPARERVAPWLQSVGSASIKHWPCMAAQQVQTHSDHTQAA